MSLPLIQQSGKGKVNGCVAEIAAVLEHHLHEGDAAIEAIIGSDREDRRVAAAGLAERADVVVRNDWRLRQQLNRISLPLLAL